MLQVRVQVSKTIKFAHQEKDITTFKLPIINVQLIGTLINNNVELKFI